MKFFIDTADVAEIRALNALGLVDGVTTNPSLIAKSGRDMSEAIKEICDVVAGTADAHRSGRNGYLDRTKARELIPLDAVRLVHGSRGSPALSWHACQHFLIWMDERRELVLRAGGSV